MNLPVVGRLFGTTNDTTDRTELVMLITPHVVRNRDEAQVVTEAFKDKVNGARNELERFRLEQERLKLRRQQLPAQPEDNNPVPGTHIPPNTSSAPRDLAPAMPGPSLPQHTPQNPAPPQPSISLNKRGKKNAPPVEPAYGVVAPSRAPDVAIVTELTNRTPPLPWPLPMRELPGELNFPAEPMQIAQRPPLSEGIPSALSVRSTDPIGQFEQPAPIKPALGNPVAPADRVVGTARKIDGPTNQPVLNHIFMVQVAALAQQKDADRMVNTLRQKGYDARVIRVGLNSRLPYRVRVGQLTDRNEALALQNTLKSNERFADSYVSRILVR